jgi:FAD binding domain
MAIPGSFWLHLSDEKVRYIGEVCVDGSVSHRDRSLDSRSSAESPLLFSTSHFPSIVFPKMADLTDIPIEHTQVPVIGASMVGMTLTALLARHEVRECIIVDKHSTTAIHPHAAHPSYVSPNQSLLYVSFEADEDISPHHANLP